ncbi:DUF4179 domain-containing protein [Psychrobacillus lasiicapitis]|uniref:DUF4179 domain-containing protein n=1 Tax=Psychrobacillus lasiicapitis TaxID=1636719 RepID=A0A544SWL1_9BACI|nr:DUF4179 domain-containing protein [Psychrobacillus lasiicapitis]TQR09592.1 DUF4179 domain-containing protein [Psychrobacillus lasiicapitis]GGA29176.1 hypothetical protein GCM10011384_18340 [Psychrobacillus lasiicapitis]
MSIFKELNNVKLNVSEFEEKPLSALEQKRIQKKIFNKILTKKKKKNYFLLAAASFIVISSLTISLTFPAFAAKLPIISNIFQLLSNNEYYVFEEYDEHSTDIGLTEESNGISITATNAVYDGENITIAYTITSEEDLGERPVLEGNMVVDEFGDQYEYNGFDHNFIVEKISDHEYAVVYIYQLLKGTKPDAIKVTWAGDSVRNLNNVEQETFGNWTFQFSLNKLDNKTKKYAANEFSTVDEGIEVELTKITQTPISSTIYLSELVDERLVSQEKEEMRGVQIEYLISDNLGKEYNYVHYRDTGHSTDFDVNHKSYPRVTTTVFDEAATTLTITPIVLVMKVDNPNTKGEGPLVPVMEPYTIESIQVPINKN